MLYIVSYDISDPKRLRKVFNTLKDFGVSVQYSVFECDLTLREVKDMVSLLSELIDLKEDSLLVYPVCRDCRQKVKLSGQGRIWIDQKYWVY